MLTFMVARLGVRLYIANLDTFLKLLAADEWLLAHFGQFLE